MQKFVRWAKAVIGHLYLVLGGTAFGIVGLVVQQYVPGGALLPKVFYGLCGAGFVSAIFLAWRDEHDALEAMKAKQQPRLRIAGITKKPFFIHSGGGSSSALLLNLDVVNDPTLSVPECIAVDVRPRLTFVANGTERLAIDGRWDNTPQPQPFQPKLVPTTLGIGEERALHIVAKFPDDVCAFAFNNYSYDHTSLKSPAYRLTEREYHIAVRMRGVGVDATTNLLLKQTLDGSDPRVELLDHQERPEAMP